MSVKGAGLKYLDVFVCSAGEASVAKQVPLTLTLGDKQPQRRRNQVVF